MELFLLSSLLNDILLCPRCNKYSTKIEYNVGWDINPEGEEKQHLQRCENCNYDRLIIEEYVFGESMVRYLFTKWEYTIFNS